MKDAESKLAQAETDYTNAVKALNDAQKQENKDRDALAQAQKDYDNALQELNKLETELKNEEKTITTTSIQWIKNQYPSTTAEMGNVVALRSSSQSKATKKNTQSAKSANEEKAPAYISTTVKSAKKSNKATKKNALPQMGDEDSNKAVWGEISLAMAGILATLGLAGRKRRN